MTIKQYKKLARAKAHANRTSYQSELDTLSRENGYDSWGPFQAHLRAAPVNGTDETHVDRVADLLEALRLCMGRGKHLVVNRGGNTAVELHLIEELREYIATLGGGPVERIRYTTDFTDIDLDTARRERLTHVTTSRGFRRIVEDGDHTVSGPDAILSPANAIARLSDRAIIEATTEVTLAIGRSSKGLAIRTDTMGRTTITKSGVTGSDPVRAFVEACDLGGAGPDREEIAALLEDALHGYLAEPRGTNIHEYVEGYEFYGDGFHRTPDEDQKRILRYAIADYLENEAEDAARTPAPFHLDDFPILRGPVQPYANAHELRKAWDLPRRDRPTGLREIPFVPAWNALAEDRLPRSTDSDRKDVLHDYFRQICLVLGDRGEGYFESQARNALYGFILMHREDPARTSPTSLPGVVDMMRDIQSSAAVRHMGSQDENADSMAEEIETRVLAISDKRVRGEVAEALSGVLKAAPNERSGILGTADLMLLPFKNAFIRRLTS